MMLSKLASNALHLTKQELKIEPIPHYLTTAAA